MVSTEYNTNSNNFAYYRDIKHPHEWQNVALDNLRAYGGSVLIQKYGILQGRFFLSFIHNIAQRYVLLIQSLLGRKLL
jgi:hypothetical protein